MTAVLEVTPEERVPLAFVLAVEIGHLSGGTREHRDIAQGLREVYSSLLDSPDGPLLLEFSNDELYMIGVRIFADSSELEEYWLDNRSSMRALHQPAPFPDENFGRAVERLFPDAAEHPDEWHFDSVRQTFQDLSRKIDAAMREYVPRVRGLYNKERKEIIRRTLEMQRRRADERSARYPRRPDAELWRQAVRADQLGVGEMMDVDIEGRHILVANTGDGFHAIDAYCTHVRALNTISNLSDGRLDLDRKCVECPWHGSQFDLVTGKAVRQPYAKEFNREHFFGGRLASVLDPNHTATDTRVYPTKLIGNYVFVNIA